MLAVGDRVRITEDTSFTECKCLRCGLKSCAGEVGTISDINEYTPRNEIQYIVALDSPRMLPAENMLKTKCLFEGFEVEEV
jgi:hypothetical protein